MHANAKLVETFYGCFRDRDFRGMIACYHEQIVFSDPVFPRLAGTRAGAMWHMLVARSSNTRIAFSDVVADDTSGSASWTADYLFGETKRLPVHNEINARFVFRDGKIIEHVDHFSFWKWAAMALGFPGAMLGWTPLMKNKVRAMAKKQLDTFVAQHAEYASAVEKT